MRIGVKPGQMGLDVATLRRLWREADDAGFESVWTFDHLTKSHGQVCYEATALLAAMAETTSRVRIGCLVLANGTRRVETLAATLATIDALADGRLEVGLGSASQFAREDFEALGIPWEGRSQRVKNYERAVERLIELTSPQSPLAAIPVQSPVPLILGGASAPIRRLAMQRSLAWNLSTDSVDEFRRLSVGQPDPQAQVFVDRTPSVSETAAAFREAGATRLVLILQPPIQPDTIRRLAAEAGL